MKIQELKAQAYDLNVEVIKDRSAINEKLARLQEMHNDIETLEGKQDVGNNED